MDFCNLEQNQKMERIDRGEAMAVLRGPRGAQEQRLPGGRRGGGHGEPDRLEDRQPRDEVRLRDAEVVLRALHELGQEMGRGRRP